MDALWSVGSHNVRTTGAAVSNRPCKRTTGFLNFCKESEVINQVLV